MQVSDMIGFNLLSSFDRLLHPLLRSVRDDKERLRSRFFRGCIGATLLCCFGWAWLVGPVAGFDPCGAWPAVERGAPASANRLLGSFSQWARNHGDCCYPRCAGQAVGLVSICRDQPCAAPRGDWIDHGLSQRLGCHRYRVRHHPGHLRDLAVEVGRAHASDLARQAHRTHIAFDGGGRHYAGLHHPIAAACYGDGGCLILGSGFGGLVFVGFVFLLDRDAILDLRTLVRRRGPAEPPTPQTNVPEVPAVLGPPSFPVNDQ